MINPKAVMQLKSIMDKFRMNHPKVPMFLQAASGKVQEGCVIEVTLTDVNGTPMTTNFRVTKDDMEAVQLLKEMAMKK